MKKTILLLMIAVTIGITTYAQEVQQVSTVDNNGNPVSIISTTTTAEDQITMDFASEQGECLGTITVFGSKVIQASTNLAVSKNCVEQGIDDCRANGTLVVACGIGCKRCIPAIVLGCLLKYLFSKTNCCGQ